MALSDPQTITINGVAKTLNQVEVNGSSTVYRSADETLQLTVSHQRSGNRTRRLVGFQQTAQQNNPLTGNPQEVVLRVNFVIDEPGADWAFNDTYVGQVIEGMKSLFDSTMQGKVLGGQH